MEESVFHKLLQLRWLIIALSVCFLAMSAAGIPKLTFSDSYEVFFGEENPELQAFNKLQRTYAKEDNVIFVISTKRNDVFTKEGLGIVEKLTQDAWQLPFATRVDSISNFQYMEGVGDELLVAPMYENAESLSRADIAQVKVRTMAEPLLVNRLISADGSVTGVNVTVYLPEKEAHEASVVAKAARALATKIEQANPGYEVRTTGTVMLNYAFEESGEHDATTLMPLMYLIMFITLFLFFRSVSAVLVTFIIMVASVVTSLGLAGWLGMQLTPISISAPTLIVTLAISDCVHVALTVLHLMRKGKTKREAIAESLHVNTMPVILTSVTTAIGFLSLNSSDVPPFRDLGNIVAIGVAVACIYALLVMPALVSVLPLKPKHTPSALPNSMERLGNWVISRQQMLMWGITAVVLVLGAFNFKNEINDQFVKYFDTSTTFRADSDYTIANLTGLYQISYSIGSGRENGITSVSYLEKMDEFVRWLRSQPEVMHVNALTDTMKRLNRNLHSDDENWYKLPESDALAAQYLLLYEMSLPFGMDLNNQLDVAKQASRVIVTIGDVTSKEMLALNARAEQWLRDNAPAYMHSQGTGPAVMFAYIGQRNIWSMMKGNISALVIISLLLVFMLRSVRIGLMSLVPNLLPAFVAFGLWGLLVGKIGLAVSVVSGMTLGIVVDDTIHFLNKYLHAKRRLGYEPADAARYAYHTVGSAMLVTTLSLVLGFSMLSLSAFELNASMGQLSAVTFVIALLTDLILLPILLIKMESRNAEIFNAIPAGDVVN